MARCELTRSQATPHAQRHELSREVHRVGYHFPTEVVSQVCTHYGIRLDSSGRLVGENDTEQLFMKISQKGEVVLNESVRDQVTINTEAKEIIRDLFPKIPDNDLFQIIKTAFQLGTNRVGTAEEIPLVRRAQLAVVAHIRHSYTDYDRLLRRVAYNDARHAVEEQTLQKLVEWRDADKPGDSAHRRNVDDAVKEIVVLSDEEESDSELEEGQVDENEDVKVRSARRAEQPAVATEHRPVPLAELSSGEEAPQGYRFLTQTVKRPEVASLEADNQARLQSRYARLDQVRQRYYSAVSAPQPAQVIARVPIDERPIARTVAPPSYDVRYVPAAAVQYRRNLPQPVSQHISRIATERTDNLRSRGSTDNPTQVRIVREPSPPHLVRGADGRLYERVPQSEIEVLPRAPYNDLATTQAFSTYVVSRRSATPPARVHRWTPSRNDTGTILPSIEHPDSGYATQNVRQDLPSVFTSSSGLPVPQGNLIDLTNSAEQATRRMQLDRPSRRSPRVTPATVRPDIVMIDDEQQFYRRPPIEIYDRDDDVYRSRTKRYPEPIYTQPREQETYYRYHENVPEQHHEDILQRRVLYEEKLPQEEIRYVQAPYHESQARRPTRYIEDTRPTLVEVLPREPPPDVFIHSASDAPGARDRRQV